MILILLIINDKAAAAAAAASTPVAALSTATDTTMRTRCYGYTNDHCYHYYSYCGFCYDGDYRYYSAILLLVGHDDDEHGHLQHCN